MKIYILDMGWEGYAVAVADNAEEAFTLMKENHPRIPSEWTVEEVMEYVYTKGYVDGSVGDA
jgi:hypothetical protein